MTDEELRAYNSKRQVKQLGIVVSDLDEAVKAWTEVYRVGPWSYLHFTNENIDNQVCDGKSVKEKFSYRIAASFIGDLQIELVEANETVPIYQEFLERTGGGIHHFKEKIADENMQEELERFRAIGSETMFGGNFYNLSFYYPDTQKNLGIQIELGNCEKLKKE
ncbi:MAG: VOC family protein [Pyramidobacter sp.]|nr:VOC family protein [Pyramidobacter sp.]